MSSQFSEKGLVKTLKGAYAGRPTEDHVFLRLQRTIPKQCMHKIAFYSIYAWLLGFGNKFELIFVLIGKFELTYWTSLELVSGSLNGARVQLPDFRAQAHPPIR